MAKSTNKETPANARAKNRKRAETDNIVAIMLSFASVRAVGVPSWHPENNLNRIVDVLFFEVANSARM